MYRIKEEYRRSKKSTGFVSKPEIIGYFSVDGERNYLPDSSQLLYYNRPRNREVYLDLNRGIELAVRKPAHVGEERIGHLLEWLKLNHSKIKSSETGKWIQPKFVGSCGSLTRVLCTPFRHTEGWIICAAKWKGTIYLCSFKTPEEIETNDKIPPKFTSWGFKFEQYILSDAPDKAPDVSRPVIEPAEFRCIFKRQFGDHTVLFTAEMDGLRSEKALKDPLPLNKLKFVELKTQRIIQGYRQVENFRRTKLLRWWAQSFLVGVDEILCGFRDDRGVVRNLESYSLDEIIDLSKRFWYPAGCTDYCQSFLTRVEDTVVNECDKTIYKFEKKPSGDIVTTELSPSSEYAFLPSSFLQTAR